WPSSASAQRLQIRPGGEVDSSQVARYTLAETYLRAGQFDRAITLLEDLHADSPETYVFFDKLLEAYENVKQYDDAIALVESQMDSSAQDDQLRVEKARLQYLKGDEEAALATWNAILDGASSSRYRMVYGSMIDVRLFEQAAEVLERGREAAGEPSRYRTELAYLYSLNGRHKQAAQEYTALLGETPNKLSFVRNRLSRFVDQAGALDSTITVLEGAVQKEPLNRSYRELLGWLYLEHEDYRKALNAYRAIDRLEQEQGRVLFYFARQAADAGAFDVASEAYDEILRRYPDAPVVPEARLGLGEMHQRWAEATGEQPRDARGNRQPSPHYDAALAAYRTFLQEHPNHTRYPEVLRRIGQLQQDVYLDLGAAEATLQEVIDRYGNSDAALEARYDLGRIALLRGNLDGANLMFSRLVEELRLGELAERARYEMALIHFYRSEFETARTLASAIDENTSTDVANDAIELKVLLTTNKGPDSLNTPLQLYAEASLTQRQRQPGAAVQLADSLLGTYGRHPLADEARFLRARALRADGRTEAALSAFQELPLIHPQSQYADRSLFEAADLQANTLGAIEDAIETYTTLLTDYPGSLLAPDARKAIRRLRGDQTS
ncbi:MAG: tetratricopeptide repeat protein, partial [Bacteroidetes bacterium]|nr:tetratricopeptide repeat protein [Bacteroidota bacterium]